MQRSRDFTNLLFIDDLCRKTPNARTRHHHSHNPKVTGSNPVPATNRFKHLAQPYPLGFLLPGVHVMAVQCLHGNCPGHVADLLQTECA